MEMTLGPSIELQAIINPISGLGSKRNIPGMIERMCASTGWLPSIAFSEYAGHAREITRQAIERGVGIIIAVGGDGTVNEVATSMVHSNAILGIIPRGSGNGLARDLHIPMDTHKALKLIAKGHVTTIDGCRANEHIFFTTCGLGFDAAVSQKFAAEKHRGSLTYVRRTISEYLYYKPEVYELHFGSEAVKETAFLVACANASQYGNNAFIAPHASVSDGKLDVTILAPFTPLEIPSLSFQLFTKTIERNSKIKTFQVTELCISRQNQGLIHLDGDPVMAGREIHISVVPQALKVFAPDNITSRNESQNLFERLSSFFNSRFRH
ncbi:MAG: diacylglycerol kinase family lipid kinase [Tannerellaceae bacterium]|jgi:YegS/Rv2252/BmrU family lipid kinase|nr:diacylglycerol kinase family lipid kinase [Tannerellaceae bacterium]